MKIIDSDGRQYIITDHPLIIGRGKDSGLPLDDQRASRHHARVYRHGEQAYVEDMGSTNGTNVNSQRIIEPTLLETGDVIEIGSTALVYRHDPPLEYPRDPWDDRATAPAEPDPIIIDDVADADPGYVSPPTGGFRPAPRPEQMAQDPRTAKYVSAAEYAAPSAPAESGLLEWLRRTRYMMRVQTSGGRWGMAAVWLDIATGTIRLKSPWFALLNPVNLSVQAHSVDAVIIEMKEPILSDGLIVWLLAAMFRVKLPVVRIMESSGQQVTCRAVQVGRQGRALTRFMALDISDFLRARGRVDVVSNLADDGRWRGPAALTWATIALVALTAFSCCALQSARILMQ